MAGFTLIEALIALAILASSLGAIGELAAYTHRLEISMMGRIAEVETAQKIIAGLPARGDIGPGGLTGQTADQRWRVFARLYQAGPVETKPPGLWSPEEIVIEIQDATGARLRVNTIRLVKKGGG